ncbi:hypothetical protein AAHC03_010062 [Spirometra sp. Aus1]
MHKEKKAERKLNELIELWRSRSEAWEPSTKIEQRLIFARRSVIRKRFSQESTLDLGLSSSTNPLTATKAGQEALQDFITNVRDLALALAKVSSSVRSGRGTSHLNADVTKHFEERVRKLQSRKLLIKQAFELVSQSCSTYNVEEFEQLIPYKDSPADVQEELKADAAQEAGEDIAGLLREREELLVRLRDVDTELNRCRSAFNSAIWELNDLSAPVGD